MSSSQEFIVRVPKEINKKFNVMRFGSALNVDPSKWKTCHMVRENELKDQIKAENDLEFNDFGAGSEFGRKQREEMRRKKYTKKSSSIQQPWLLKTGGKQSKKYKGFREGGVSENASYYVFFQAPDGAFEAFPVKEWYNFTPIQRYKALTAEEAEEKFEKRDKILNYFSVMINKKRKDEEMAENSTESKAKIKKELKVSDMDEWNGMDSENERSDFEGGSDEDIKPKIKNKKKDTKNKKKSKSSKKKKKGSDDDDDDSEPQEESDEGDFDDKEVDYMSDSSDSSEESETEKIDKEMKSVVDEDALRQLVLSEDEEEEEDKESQQEKKEDEKGPNTDKSTTEDKKSKFKDKLTANFDSPPPSSSDSDSDDPDSVDVKKSALLAPVKQESDKSSRGSSRSATPTTNLDNSVGNSSLSDSNKLKRKIVSQDSTSHMKKAKLSNEHSETITEEAIRRYLMRKPMTCTELLQKLKNKVSFSGDLVHMIAQILKRLNPEKQTIKNKLYFSLKPT